MTKQNILVTGGLGYIGSHTVVELIQSGYVPVIIDNLSNSTPEVLDGIEKITGYRPNFYKVDVLDNAAVERTLRKNEIDGVIHFAAFMAVGESVQKPLMYYHNNVGGILSLLNAMERSGVEKLIFSSSCTVYGQPKKLPVTETSPTVQAESPYGNTKKICEEILTDISKTGKNKAIALRYFNPVGAHPSSFIGQSPKGVPNNLVPFITQTMAGWREKLTVFGNDYNTPDGTCIRDYLHVVDLAKAHIKAMEYLQAMPMPYDIFNIGTGNGSTVLQVIKAFEEATSQKLNYFIGDRRQGDVEKVWANSAKANKVLGWKAEAGLREMMRDAWNWQCRLERPGL